MDKTKVNLTINIVMVISIILFGILSFLLFIVIGKEKLRAKVIYNGKEIKGINFKNMVYVEGPNTYINIDKLLNQKEFTGYRINAGIYKSSKIPDKAFYIESIYEVVQFEKEPNDSRFYKYSKIGFQNRKMDKFGNPEMTKEEKQNGIKRPQPQEDKSPISKLTPEMEVFRETMPIKYIANERFLPVDTLKYALNVKIIKRGNEINLLSVDYLEKLNSNILANKGYSVSSNYRNRRSIVDDLIVVGLGENFGVAKIVNKDLEVIIGTQYKDLRFCQNNMNIYCQKNEKDVKIGLLNILSKKTIIEPGEYSKIEVYLDEQNVYLIQRGGKIGLTDINGKVIAPIEYEEIGYNINEYDFPYDDYVKTKGGKLFATAIPVKKAGLWGFVDITGESKYNINPKFVSLGSPKYHYVKPTGEKQSSLDENARNRVKRFAGTSVYSIDNLYLETFSFTNDINDKRLNQDGLLYHPQYGIVVKTEENKYGIINPRASDILFNIAARFERFYQLKEAGSTEYYMEYLNEQNQKVAVKVRKGEVSSNATVEPSYSDQSNQGAQTLEKPQNPVINTNAETQDKKNKQDKKNEEDSQKIKVPKAPKVEAQETSTEANPQPFINTLPSGIDTNPNTQIPQITN